MRIVIVGAGLAGLAAAICFAKAGHEVTVFERQHDLSPQGGIIQLRPSALRVLYDHGLQSQITAVSRPVGESRFRMLLDGQVVRSEDLREHQVASEGLARATTRQKLSRTLFDAAISAGATFKFDMTVRGFDEGTTAVNLQFEDGSTCSADLLLAADGIRSRLRSQILSDVPPSQHQPIVTDATFYVFHLPAGRFPEDVRQRMSESNGPWARVDAWLGKESWAMSAFDNTEDLLNLGLTIVEPTNQTNLWDENGNVPYVRDFFQTLACQEIRNALEIAETCDRWRLAYMPGLPRWTSQGGRVSLLGDAAHAILPNGGAGISLTIEDIGALSHLISRNAGTPDNRRADVAELLSIWEQACKPRAERVRDFGVFNMRRLEGDKVAIAQTKEALIAEAETRLASMPDMHAQFSTLSFARYLSAYDPVAAVETVYAKRATANEQEQPFG